MGSCVIAMNNKVWSMDLDEIVDDESLIDVKKFHQSTCTINRYSGLNPLDSKVLQWLKENEYTQTLPNNYLQEIQLKKEKRTNIGSKRNYSKNYITKYEMSKILFKAFGSKVINPSKPYPSAGALYPITPVLVVLEDDEYLKRGCYIYNCYKNSLLHIKVFTYSDIKEIKNIISFLPNNEFISNYFMAYAINLKKAIAKYKKRGYRYSLIEIGLMCQSLRYALHHNDFCDEMGELIWAGFDDNALTNILGLNVSDFPIGLIQWFGK